MARPPFDSLPKPPPGGTPWSREFVALLIDSVESSTREELEQGAGLVAIRHVWPTYSPLTMLREMRRELRRMAGGRKMTCEVGDLDLIPCKMETHPDMERSRCGALAL